MRKTWQWYCFFALVLALPGCKSLNKELSFDLEDGIRAITVDPVDKDQTIKIDVKVTGGPVDFWVYLDKDANTSRKDFPVPKDTAKILKHVPNSQGTTIEVPIPANNAAVVLFKLATGKGAKVTVKLTN